MKSSKRIVAVITVCCGLLVFLLASVASATTYIAEPVLVTQPAYEGMSFYVYRPSNMPAGWFVTFDGYPVSQTAGGVWVYGSNQNGQIIPTSYVVGSIVPTAVALTPVFPAQAMAAPAQTVQGAVSVPAWVVDANFTAVANWSKTIDRMAVLDKPRVPIAWRHDVPEVIYAWTGRSWFSMRVPSGHTPADTLSRHLYEIVNMVHQNNFWWNDAETAVLANQATIWGYLWMGVVAPADVKSLYRP